MLQHPARRLLFLLVIDAYITWAYFILQPCKATSAGMQSSSAWLLLTNAVHGVSHKMQFGNLPQFCTCVGVQ